MLSEASFRSLQNYRRHDELRITSPNPCLWVLEQITSFADFAPWRPHSNGIVPEENGIGPHCVIVCDDGQLVVGLSFVAPRGKEEQSKHHSSVRLTNIFPQTVGSISVEQYNTILRTFVRDFKNHLRSRKLPMNVRHSVFQLSLNNAVPSPKTRAALKVYLRGHPLTFHPSDVENLDEFIRCAHRFHARVDVDALCAYLVCEKHWPKSAVEVARERIVVGSQILKSKNVY